MMPKGVPSLLFFFYGLVKFTALSSLFLFLPLYHAAMRITQASAPTAFRVLPNSVGVGRVCIWALGLGGC